MKIALLTCAYSVVVEQLAHLTEPGDFAVVDFSRDGALADACGNMHITHVTFATWEQVKEELPDFDLLVSYKLNRIIPMDIVGRFTFGGVNIHPSLLPRYPGANPWFQMYYNMDLDTGVTVHRIAEKPDSGNIIARQSFRMESGQPLPVAIKNADNIAAHLITDVIFNRRFLNPGTEQPTASGHSNSTIELNSLKRLPVERLWHILRGFPSLISMLYPELPHKYFEVGEYSRQPMSLPDSKVIDRGDKGRWIACNDGIISLWDFSEIPMTQDYIDAIAACQFMEARLQKATFEKNNDGSLSFMQGREAIVFPANIDGEKVAIRFPKNKATAQISEYTTRLKTVHSHLQRHNITHFAKFDVLSQAIRLPKGIFPALIMKLYSGETLMSYLRRSLHDRKQLESLQSHFITICSTNHRTGIVHGDIHSGNIIIGKLGNISILDIDGIWTSELGLIKDNGGNRNWQHPIRVQNKYITDNIDNFSEIIVCATIYTAMFAPNVFERYSNGDCLFHENDYISPNESSLLSELSHISECKPLSTLIFQLSQERSLDEIPTVETIKLFRI